MLPWIAHPLLASTGYYVTNVKYVKCLCNINLWTRSKYGRICNLLYIWQHVNRGSLVWSTCMSMAGRMAHCYELQDWHIPDVWSGDLLEFMAYSHRTWAGQGLGPIFTARKRSLVQDNVFTGVCLSRGHYVTNVKYVKCLCNINLWTRSKYGRICNLLYIWQHVNRGSLVWSTCMSMAGRMAHCYELQDWHIPDVWSGDLLEFMAYSHRTWAGQGLGPIFTARKRSLVQDNVFTGVCLSTGAGASLAGRCHP